MDYPYVRTTFTFNKGNPYLQSLKLRVVQKMLKSAKPSVFHDQPNIPKPDLSCDDVGNKLGLCYHPMISGNEPISKKPSSFNFYRKWRYGYGRKARISTNISISSG